MCVYEFVCTGGGGGGGGDRGRNGERRSVQTVEASSSIVWYAMLFAKAQQVNTSLSSSKFHPAKTPIWHWDLVAEKRVKLGTKVVCVRVCVCLCISEMPQRMAGLMRFFFVVLSFSLFVSFFCFDFVLLALLKLSAFYVEWRDTALVSVALVVRLFFGYFFIPFVPVSNCARVCVLILFEYSKWNESKNEQ